MGGRFDPRWGVPRWMLLAFIIGTVVGFTGPGSVDALAMAWATDRSALPWVIDRLFAFLAYLALTGSVVYGLLLSTKLLDAVTSRPISYTLHRDLAITGLALAAAHGALLAIDDQVPFQVAEIVVPGLAPHAPIGVAAGQVAFYLMALLMASFHVRRRIGQRTWRALHYVSFLAFMGATAHGILAGTDTSRPWAWATYVAATVMVVFLSAYRIGLARSQTSSRRIRPPAQDRAPRTEATSPA